MTLLKTVNLRKQFGETRACDGVNFVVNQGEFLSLVGSNGAGKTTLVNLISAHLQPDSGQILFEDRDITFATVTDRIKAGIVRSFQIVNLFDGLSFSTMSRCRSSRVTARPCRWRPWPTTTMMCVARQSKCWASSA